MSRVEGDEKVPGAPQSQAIELANPTRSRIAELLVFPGEISAFLPNTKGERPFVRLYE
ncbi:MAG TPA: hypothetical protein VF329_06040 [Gammaproteobacteria bacterium]